MFLDTRWVNRKLKFALPSAGLEIPSIFCSTHGPRSVSVVAPAAIVCHGQANLTLGRWASTPTRCSAADRVISTTDAIARRKIRPTTTAAAAHLTPVGMRRPRGPRPPAHPPEGPALPAARPRQGGTGPG